MARRPRYNPSPINEYLATAHAILKAAGFRRRTNSTGKAPTARVANRAFIYVHPKVTGDIWVTTTADGGKWRYVVFSQGVFGGHNSTVKSQSTSLAALESLVNTATRTNPAPAAAELFEAWTGEPSTHETVVVDTIHDHAHLTDLARLVAFKLRGVRGQLKFTDHATRLCSNETGTQLYIRGGDQAINLDDFNTVSTRRVDPTKDSVVLGEIEYLYYSARKPFLGKEHTKTGVYKHKLGEETGNRPVLLYDTRSALLSISGGSYYIKPGDYDGKHSRGIVD